ncbi:hypothetical protein ACFQX6_64990 [Streptosporangium lutulentum]
MAVQPIEEFAFSGAYRNFYRSAIHGLDARLSWPGVREEIPAAQLALDLLPIAAAGLQRVGVEADEAEWALDVIRERVTRRRTGAIWQREAMARFGGDQAARERMVIRYRELSMIGEPVHTWPL